ncbi:glycosyltransferase family 29 protein [Acinetobacter oleivorans]|uniref:glycosyltransferase family 29 protein n=1 Tax=Acinetobacter oleivorans TaxID=1148157 RepID=UPI001CD2274E|nr:glycosyltransferase family 29 protein [Acinetobacter oleivorans]
MNLHSKKIILVANSNAVFNINGVINDQDIVVRFNSPDQQKIEMTGSRTDLLFLANTVDLMEKRLKNKEFNNFVETLEKTTVLFPFEDDLINKINPIGKVSYRKFFIKFKKYIKNSDNEKYINYFFDKNIKVDVIDQSYYWTAKDSIDKDSLSILTTGFIAIFYFLNNEEYRDYDIYLCGFTFQGWSGHDWEQEKKCVLDLIANKKVYILERANTK